MPQLKAASRAIAEALETPGCLVRITFTRPEQVVPCLNALGQWLEKHNQLDQQKTKQGVKLPNPTVELTNGSGIEFVLERG